MRNTLQTLHRVVSWGKKSISFRKKKTRKLIITLGTEQKEKTVFLGRT